MKYLCPFRYFPVKVTEFTSWYGDGVSLVIDFHRQGWQMISQPHAKGTCTPEKAQMKSFTEMAYGPFWRCWKSRVSFKARGNTANWISESTAEPSYLAFIMINGYLRQNVLDFDGPLSFSSTLYNAPYILKLYLWFPFIIFISNVDSSAVQSVTGVIASACVA